AGVVAEARRVRDGAEQAVQGAAGGGQRRQQPVLDALGGQLLRGAAQALGHALGGAAGGRGQGDTRRRLSGGRGACAEQHQQPGDRGGLAGTGTAGHQQQAVEQGDRGGTRLVVATAGRLREQAREQRRQRIDAVG